LIDFWDARQAKRVGWNGSRQPSTRRIVEFT
jgi:hypothetical protein